MFKQSRVKIVAIIMAVSVALLAGMLCIIYSISYMEMYRSNQEMLERYVDNYDNMEDMPNVPDSVPDILDIPKDEIIDTPLDRPDAIFELSTFYSVLYDAAGEVIDIDNMDGDIYSEEEIGAFADEILAKEKVSGVYKEFSFMVNESSEGTMVVFIDNTVELENFAIILKYTMLFGSITLIIIFLLSCFLADRIVKPLEVNSKKQKQFISDAGHELKTPIAVVSANLEILAREMVENKWLENIEYENQKMAALVKQLMELAKTENVTPHMENVDLSRIMEGELLPFEIVAFEKGLNLAYDELESNVIVSGNAEQLKQLIAILLDNAIEHSEENSSIIVKLTTNKNKVCISVANRGQEISKEQKEHLFDRFYRGDFSRNSDSNHYGLGLAIAKAIVNTHKGDIAVGYENGFVVFEVQLPIKKNKN